MTTNNENMPPIVFVFGEQSKPAVWTFIFTILFDFKRFQICIPTEIPTEVWDFIQASDEYDFLYQNLIMERGYKKGLYDYDTEEMSKYINLRSLFRRKYGITHKIYLSVKLLLIQS